MEQTRFRSNESFFTETQPLEVVLFLTNYARSDFYHRVILPYLNNKNEYSFVKQSFLMSLGLHSAGKNSFLSNLMKMSEYFNLNNFNPDLLDTAKIKHLVSLMKQKYISYWQQALQHSQKLELYKILKNEYAPSNYLELSTRTSERRTLTKLRVSNHKLMIELGRYNQISRDDRICQFVDLIKSKTKSIFFSTVPNTQ